MHRRCSRDNAGAITKGPGVGTDIIPRINIKRAQPANSNRCANRAVVWTTGLSSRRMVETSWTARRTRRAVRACLARWSRCWCDWIAWLRCSSGVEVGQVWSRYTRRTTPLPEGHQRSQQSCQCAWHSHQPSELTRRRRRCGIAFVRAGVDGRTQWQKNRSNNQRIAEQQRDQSDSSWGSRAMSTLHVGSFGRLSRSANATRMRPGHCCRLWVNRRREAKGVSLT